MRVLFAALCLLLSSAVACAAENQSAKTAGSGFYFDTYVTFTLYGADADLISDLHQLCAHYESLLSKTQVDSDVYRLNHAGGKLVTVDPETYALLQRAKEISELTDHAFSVSIAPLSELWNFKTHTIPGDAQRIAALALVDDERIVLGQEHTVSLAPGMQIDLGGIAKGYIADQAAALTRNRCTGAILNLGGNVYCTGSKPDGSAFKVGVENPLCPDPVTPAVISITDGTVVTSGTYERYFEENGIRYHHILDPQTGSPAQTDLVSATIVSTCSMDADAFATACIVLGSERSLELLKQLRLDAILITTEGDILLTPGFETRVDYQPAS